MDQFESILAFAQGRPQTTFIGEPTMARKYYSLISRTPNEKWALEFGDYDKEVVQQEMRDQKDSATEKMEFKIITTGDKQADISAAVELINSEIK